MISIIVPVYNTKEYLPRCMDSLLCQEYEKKEIILVDDGSTDGSGELCDEYERQYSCVKVLHKDNGGLMSAWMAGVAESLGEYLCFVDSDDWVEVDMLKQMSEFLTGTGREIVVCNHSIDRENGEKTFQTNGLAPGVYEGDALEKDVFLQLLGNEVRRVCFSRCMKLISRELIVKNLKFCDQRIRMGEDLNIMLPAILDAQRLVIMRDAYFYHYYYNQSSMVHKYDAGLYDNIRYLRKIMYQVIAEKYKGSEKADAMKKRADMEYIFLLLLTVKNEARGNQEGYRHNIKILCGEERELIQNTPVKVETKANRLLYLTLKDPNFFSLTLLRMAMLIYYR